MVDEIVRDGARRMLAEALQARGLLGHPGATVQASLDIADVEALLVRAERLTIDTPTASAVKNAMRDLALAFDESNYGCSRFREFLSRLPHRVRTVGPSGSMDITVALTKDTDAANTPDLA